MNEDKELEEAIKVLLKFRQKINAGKRILDKPNFFRKIALAIETVLQALENSIPKEIIREKINERQFELQQQYKDFKDDIRLNTLQEIYYLNESER